MRRGVVMIMALALVMILTLVILRSTTTTQNYLSDMSQTIYNAQFNRTFLDMTNIIKNATKEIKDADMFATLVKMPLVISDEKSELEGVLRMSSAASRFNINEIIDVDKNNTINQTLYDVIYSTMRDYQVADALFFLSMVLDLVDSDAKERAFGSEIAHIDGASVGDGGITNKMAFKKILDAYAKSRDDGTIYKVPWDEIITFSGKKTDYNYLTSKIKAVLERDYGISTPYDNSLIKNDSDLSLSKEQKKVLKSLHIKYYVPRLLCNFEFYYMNKNMSIDFIYDLELRRISHIETIF